MLTGGAIARCEETGRYWCWLGMAGNPLLVVDGRADFAAEPFFEGSIKGSWPELNGRTTELMSLWSLSSGGPPAPGRSGCGSGSKGGVLTFGHGGAHLVR
ncbi:hypothetical protein GCM10010245_42680 [Streptomyces spectabilis]|nr:hypothetical protein GCM10010245_42680 [Streptomyces spectabilis]